MVAGCVDRFFYYYYYACCGLREMNGLTHNDFEFYTSLPTLGHVSIGNKVKYYLNHWKQDFLTLNDIVV